jgi:lambda family phage portal protein
VKSKLETTTLDRVFLSLAPKWGLERIRARAAAVTMLRHFEAAASGYRTDPWQRSTSDANMAAWGALSLLRQHARDLIRNNAWAQNGQRVITRNTVGWGLTAKPVGAQAKQTQALWGPWAGTDEIFSTQCDADRRLTFAGMQTAVIKAVAQDGEVLIRRRPRRSTDGHTVPLQIQLLEADFLDLNRSGFAGPAGGPTIQGVEFDQRGQRTAYWLFDRHPGSGLLAQGAKSAQLVSRRIPEAEILHIYRLDRPGQVRGIPWFAPVIIKLKDFDEYDDATLMRQKIAACFTAFVTDTEGDAGLIGPGSEPGQAPLPSGADDERLEPGLVNYLPPGKSITFSNPPGVNDHASYSASNLRQVAAGLGVTYEDLSLDYSQVNFSSARMSRLAHWGNVHDWRWHMLVPQFNARVWEWFIEAAVLAGELPEGAAPGATWTPPPMPMIEPDKEGLAYQRLVRAGAMTPSEMVREQGNDPDAHFEEYAADLARLDKLNITLDSDARRTTQAGMAQLEPGSATGDTSKPEVTPAEEKAAAA